MFSLKPRARVAPPILSRVRAGCPILAAALMFSFAFASAAAQSSAPSKHESTGDAGEAIASSAVSPATAAPSAAQPARASDTTLFPSEVVPDDPVARQRQQLSLQAAQILAIATALRRDVYGTRPGVLSLDVVRRAQTIEKLAQGVKDQIKHAKAR